MAKFPDPTKQYEAQPLDKPIDATKLDTKQYTPPVPPPPAKAPKPPAGTLPPTPNGAPPPPSSTPLSSPPVSKSPFKNIIPLILGLIAFAGIAYAVVIYVIPLFGTKEPDPVTLTYWGLWEPQSLMQTVISDYERQNPYVKINYTMQEAKNYRTRLQSAIASGEGPDIARIHNTWLPMLASSLAPAPAEIVTSSDLASYYPIVQKDLVANAKIYALPLMLDGIVLYYNTDILESSGHQPPTDWNELRKLAFQLTVRNAETGIIERAGAALGTASNIDHWSDVLGLLIIQNSGDPGQPSSDAVKDALTFYTIFSAQDKVWDETQPNSTYAFATGSVAMILAPAWQAQQIEAINPDLNYGVVASPILAGTNYHWATYWAESVPSSSKNQEEAWKFIKFLSTKDSLQKLYTAQAQLRGHGEAYPLKELSNLLADDPVNSVIVSQAGNYVSWYLSDRTQDEGINDEMIKYYEDAVNAINQGRSVQSTLKTLSSGVEQILTRYPSAK